ncbi:MULTISPECIES: HAD family hydrolase [Empedobacter]|nr:MULTISPECIES: HAD hydrolase-like protein [Empedobacter]MDM1547551.1 HAD hydrolase-like protein [Empedobacter falsenii]
MNPTIVLDFDDTLIDTKQRQYQVIKTFFNSYQIEISDFENYLKYRILNKASNTDFASQYLNNEIQLEDYKNYFKTRIESDDFLKYDQLIVEVELLKKISLNYKLVLLSLRTHYNQGEKQLSQLGLKEYFSEIYFLKHHEINPKTDILINLKQKFYPVTFIGDTISDYEAANKSEVDFYGVNTGLFSLSNNINTFEDINQYLITKL